VTNVVNELSEHMEQRLKHLMEEFKFSMQSHRVEVATTLDSTLANFNGVMARSKVEMQR
jgi:hypothetical protein